MNNLDLIKQLEDLKYHCQDFAEDEMEKEIQPFTDDVKALDQAINELRWIPVEEKLPSENETVLASLDFGNYKTVVIMDYEEKVFYENVDGWSNDRNTDNVVAWKPLPKPMKRNKTLL